MGTARRKLAADAGLRRLSPELRQILADAMLCTALMVANIKFQGRLTLQVCGDGPVTMLVMQSSDNGVMRGLAQWRAIPEQGDLQACFGNGQILITIDQNQIKECHQGVVELKGACLSEAISHYFAHSEQLPTHFYLFADRYRAVGLMLQKFPEQATANDDDWQRVCQLANTLTASEALSLDTQTLLYRLFNQETVRLLDTSTVSYQCNCSRERTAALVKSLEREEAEVLIAERGVVTVTCEFCQTQYAFDAVDITQLFADTHGAGDPSLIIH